MRGICLTTLRVVLLGVALAVLGPAGAASATVPGTLLTSCSPKDGADNNLANGAQLPYTFCDDGVPAFGGTTPNPTGANAITVPGSYAGATGLPAQSGTVPGADATGKIALDVDVSLPTGAGAHPLVAMMHGCCGGSKMSWEARGNPADDPGTIDSGGEAWHYDSAWWASRGYIVLTYTARGFVDSQGHGSTGEAQLDSDRFEINDFQD